ncbi:MAG: mmsr1 [Moraxellaceae bacterium]|jgi:AraC-like DNA-binding protein|nr:mmsr1 [Moraxellaceae bacterium]
MPIPSPWSLNPDSRRWLVPPAVRQALSRHPLAHELWPEALGYYRQAAGHAMQREAGEHEDHLLLYCVQGHGEVEWGAGREVRTGAIAGSGQTLPGSGESGDLFPGQKAAAPVSRRMTAGVTPAPDWHSEPVGPGTLVLLPAGVAHHYRSSAEQPWSLYWVHFAGSGADDFLAPLLQARSAAACQVGLGLVPDFQSLLALTKEGFVLPPLLHAANTLRALLTHAALLALRHQARRGRFDVWAVQAYMQAHLDEPLTLDQLADAFGFERFHFAKTYRRLTGRAPLTHFLHLKMERAARLLDGGELRVSEVARVLGYEDAHYFSRQFRRLMGVAPSEYRGMKRG